MKIDDQSFASWEEVNSLEGNEAIPSLLSMAVKPHHPSIGHFAAHDGTTKVCVNIKAGEMPENDESRSPVDVIAALDISGSMAGQKIKDCKRTLKLMVDHFNSKDRFGLVTYSNHAKLELPVCFMTPANKRKAMKLINSLKAGGGTNMSAGISLAGQELSLVDNPNPVRSVFLLTDGQANCGIVNTHDLVALVKHLNEDDNAVQAVAEAMTPMEVDKETPKVTPAECDVVATNSGTTLFCFGYGRDHNSRALRAMAEASPGGAYYFVEKDEDVSSAFGDAMGGLLSVVAQAVTVHLSVPTAAVSKGVKILDVHHDEKVSRPNNSYTVNVGDFYAEESRDVVFDIQVSTTPSEVPVPHVTVSLTYTDVINKRIGREGPMVCSIARPSNNRVDGLDIHVEEQWLRVLTAKQLAVADSKAKEGHLEEARQILKNHQRVLTSSAAYSADPNDESQNEVRALLLDVSDALNAFASRSTYTTTGVHFMQNCAMKMTKQRGMASASAELGQDHRDRFATKQKKLAKSLWKSSK